MKILVVVPSSHFGGGVNASAMNFCNAMSKMHDVYFLDMSSQNLCTFALDGDTKIAKMSKGSENWNITQEKLKGVKGFKRIKMGMLGLVKKLTIKSGLWYRLSMRKLKEYGEFDVAIAFRQCPHCYSFVINKVKAKKKIAFVHGELHAVEESLPYWKKYMPKFDKVAYVSKAVLDQFVEAHPELEKNACVIYNMFNVKQILERSKESPAIELDKSVKNIVTVARVDNLTKQIGWVIEICKRLKESSVPKFHWYVLGDGPNFEEMVKLSQDMGVNDVLTFTGKQKNTYSIVRSADFSVLTSKSEAYGMVVVESLILKKPIVVAEYPTIYEIMENGVHGIIEKQNVEKMYESVRKMLTNEGGILDALNKNLESYEYTNKVACSQFEEAVK